MRLKEAKMALQDAKRRYGGVVQGPQGVLQVTVIRAENLRGVSSSYVLMYQGVKTSKTKPAMGESPVYSENQIQFDVDDDQQELLVSIVDTVSGRQILETNVSLDEIKSGQIPQNKEIWLSRSESDPQAPKLRVKIFYQQNEVLRYSNEVQLLEREIKNDVSVFQQVRIFIEQLRHPFGFLQRDIQNIEMAI